jgi:hypothetical protein
MPKQYGEPAGEIFEPLQASELRPVLGLSDPLGEGPAEPDVRGAPPLGRAASAAIVPVPETVLAHPASKPQRPIKATARRLRMGPP